MSGAMPQTACIPRAWVRKPVTTSSITSAAPPLAVMSRRLRTKPSGRSSGWRLCTGSTITAAISPICAAIQSSDSGAP